MSAVYMYGDPNTTGTFIFLIHFIELKIKRKTITVQYAVAADPSKKKSM